MVGEGSGALSTCLRVPPVRVSRPAAYFDPPPPLDVGSRVAPCSTWTCSVVTEASKIADNINDITEVFWRFWSFLSGSNYVGIGAIVIGTVLGDELVTYIKVVRLIPSDRSGTLYIIRYIILAILLL